MARCARSPELRGDSDRLDVARVRTRATTPGLSPSCWFRAQAIDGQRSVARLSVCWWLAACDIHMLPLTSKIKGRTRTPISYHSLKLEITFCVQGVVNPPLPSLPTWNVVWPLPAPIRRRLSVQRVIGAEPIDHLVLLRG